MSGPKIQATESAFLGGWERSESSAARLRQLREQGAEGDDDGLGVGEAVDRLVRQVEYDLERMRGTSLFLEMEEVRRERFA